MPDQACPCPPHVDEHGDDPQQKLAGGVAAGGCRELEPDADVEHGGALGRRATSDAVEARLLGLRVLAGSFGDVEHDGSGRPAELVREIAVAGRQVGDDAVSEDDEVHGRGVDVETFVIELHMTEVGVALESMRNHTHEVLELSASG